jgi:hypothetical protein
MAGAFGFERVDGLSAQRPSSAIGVRGGSAPAEIDGSEVDGFGRRVTCSAR